MEIMTRESHTGPEITRHFTATTFVVRDGKVLLHLHLRQKLWLPPGGHIERDELPHQAAIRELEEETGLRLALHSEREAAELAESMQSMVVPQPAFILVEDINPYHQHIDFIYYADASNLASDDVLDGFEWLGRPELDREHLPQNVREGALRAIEYFAGIHGS